MGSDNEGHHDSTKSFRSFTAALATSTVTRRFFVAIIASALFLLGFLSGQHDVHGSFKPSFRSSVLLKTEGSDLSSECKVKLDALDRINDERRSVRQQLVEDALKSGKGNVYNYLWKIDTKNDARKEEKEKNNKYNMLFDVWEPEAVCLAEERLGGASDQRYNAFGDGPKFVCGVDYLREKYKASNEKCLVYSIGSNNNILFEKAVKNFIDCETHTFDPTLSSPFRGDAYASFHPWGLGNDGETIHYEQGHKNATFTSYSLEHMMKDLGHTGRTIDIFKIDCERCEYSAMHPVFDAIAKGTIQIDQILIELHSASYETITSFFEGVDKAGMRIVHKERNGWGCKGSRCVEYALVRESYLRQATAASIC